MTIEQVRPRHVEARRRPPAVEDPLGSSQASEPALTNPNDITHVGALTVGAISAYAAEVARATALACGGLWTALFIPIWALCGGNHSTGTAAALAIAASAFDACGRLIFSAFWAFDRMKLESVATWVQELSFLISSVVILELRPRA